MYSTFLSRALLLGFCLVLAACAGAPAPQPSAPDTESAEQAELRGDWASAARLWEEAARQEVPARQPALLLRAADAWMADGNTGKAAMLANRINSNLLRERDTALFYLLQAELALDAGDYQQAEFFLDAANKGLDSRLAGRFAVASTELRRQSSEPADRALITVESELAGQVEYDRARAVQWLEMLEDVPSGRLSEMAGEPGELGTWCDLALVMRQHLISGSDSNEAAEAWQLAHPEHSVDAQAFLELAWQYGARFTHPERIAVLLPESGGLSVAGAAIRDGINTAFLDHNSNAQIQFIATPDDPAQTLFIWDRTAQSGSQLIIGPLRRESVELIMAQDFHDVPGLLLNSGPERITLVPPTPGNESLESTSQPLFNLTLSQTEEARAVARRMLAAGQDRSILLVANNAWGLRSENAFIDEYLKGGGELVDIERFDATDADHSFKLTQLLRIEDSLQRKSRLQSALSLPLEFEPSRRDDFEAFFLAVDPQLGRQIKPQLKFFDAGGKPMFAMSRIFSGTIDTSRDVDLNGVEFPATAGVFGDWKDTPIGALPSMRDGALGSLHALGNDAWNVIPWLDLLARDPDLGFPGNTGILRINEMGELVREPVWAQFRRGRPQPVPLTLTP